jgi:hypothetical protein
LAHDEFAAARVLVLRHPADVECLRPLVWIGEWKTWPAKQAAGLGMAAIVEELAACCRRNGIRKVLSDQREAASLAAMFERSNPRLRFHSIPWTQQSKAEAVAALRDLMGTKRLHIEEHAKAKEQLLNYREKKLASGGFRYQGGTRFDDMAACVLTFGAAWSAPEPVLRSSPAYRHSTRTVISHDDRQVGCA